MNSNRNNILRIAVAMALTGGAVAANAALLVPAGTAFTAAQVASEVPTTGITLTAGASELTAGSQITTFAPSAGQNLLVNVQLNNGAKFLAAPTITCVTVGATALGHGTLNLGGAGSNQAVFSVGTADMTAGATDTATISACFITAASLTVTGAHADVNMSITYTYGTLASSSVNGTLVAFQSGLTASKTAGSDVVALVTGGFVNVSGGISSTVVSAGLINWMGDTTAAAASGNLSVALNLGSVLGATSGSITFVGNPLVATKTTAGIWLDAATPCTTAGAASVVATATGGASTVTFTGLTPAAISAGLYVCAQFNGTTAIQTGSITAQFGGTALAGYTLPSQSAMTLMSVSRNGSSSTVLNLPRSADSDQGFLRVYNTSSVAGPVTATIYSQGATGQSVFTPLVTNCTLTSSLAGNGALVMSVAQIVSACSFTEPTTGRYRIDLGGAFPTMRAQAFARSNNVLTNIGGDTSTTGN